MSSRSDTVSNTQGSVGRPPTNIDGAVRDEDVFVLGGEEEDEEGTNDLSDADAKIAPPTPPPAYRSRDVPASHSTQNMNETNVNSDVAAHHEVGKTDGLVTEPETSAHPQRYYISPNDTLLGIALKYKLDVS